jgi:dTDP-4-amino-4,6-dideoxygalactose transaminase
MGAEERAAVEAVLRRRELFRYTDDHEVQSENDLLEEELTNKFATAGACTVASGTAGLRASLVAVGVRPGDEVLVSAFTFIATASAIASVGARPVPLELGTRLDVDCDDLERKLPGRSAVVPVYVPGHTSNTDEVVRLAEVAGVAVVEDACQATGVRVATRAAGSIGHLGVYSFQQGKQLSSGEGGAVVARELATLNAVRRFADHGADRQANQPVWPDAQPTIGENLRMTEMQAALLRIQLGRLDGMIQRQHQLRSELVTVAKQFGAPVVESRHPASDAGSHMALLVPTPTTATEVQKRASAHRLLIRHFWRKPFTHFPAFSAADDDTTPRATDWAPRLLAVPVPPLYDDETDAFVAAAKGFFSSCTDLWP